MTARRDTTDDLEVEWQFDAPDLDAVDRWLRDQPAHAALTLRPAGEVTQTDTYYDSADWRVVLAGYALRVRERPVGAQATLKATKRNAEGPVARAEFSEPISENRPPLGDGPVGSRLQLMLLGAELRPLFVIRTHRRTWEVRRDARVLAEIALDATEIIVDDSTQSRLQRVEVEQVAPGGLTEAAVLIDALRAAGPLVPAATSKFEAGLRAAALAPGAPDLGQTGTGPDDAPTARAFAVLRTLFADFLARESGTALGEDVEELHQMRVATRRLRAALQVFEAVLPPAFQAARRELQASAAVLGAVRDLDVQIEVLEVLHDAASWHDANALSPLVAVLCEERIEARAALLEHLRGERYRTFVAGFRRSLLDGPGEVTDGAELREFTSSVTQRRLQQFVRDARKLRPSSPHPEFHALRIRGKRLRYTLEFFTDLYRQPAQVSLRALRAVQDSLGELQDLETLDLRLLAIVRTPALPPESLVMIGRLLERHHQRAEAITSGSGTLLRPLLRTLDRLERVLREHPRETEAKPEADAAAIEDESPGLRGGGATAPAMTSTSIVPARPMGLVVSPPRPHPAPPVEAGALRDVLTELLRSVLQRGR